MGSRKRDQFEWTKERADQLRKMWKDGKSGGYIGEYFGITRNAAIGKAHRLGLDRRPNPIRPRVEKVERVKVEHPVLPKLHKVDVPEDIPPLAESRNLPLDQLKTGECRFPTTPFKARHHRFCGAPAMSNGDGHKPYCFHHEQITHQAQKKEAAE